MVQDQLRNSAYDKAITRVSLHQAYNMLQQTPRWSKGGGGGTVVEGKATCMQGRGAMRALPTLYVRTALLCVSLP